jgi:hypothetical protein
MANQVGPDTVSGAAVPAAQAADAQPVSGDVSAGGTLAKEPYPGHIQDPGHGHSSFHGRPVSWVASCLILAGFIVGGLALIFGPTWPVFWVGVGITVIGGLLALATDIFDDWY